MPTATAPRRAASQTAAWRRKAPRRTTYLATAAVGAVCNAIEEDYAHVVQMLKGAHLLAHFCLDPEVYVVRRPPWILRRERLW